MGAQLDPLGQIDPERKPQEPSNDRDHEEADHCQGCPGHGGRRRDAGLAQPLAREEVLKQETGKG